MNNIISMLTNKDFTDKIFTLLMNKDFTDKFFIILLLGLLYLIIKKIVDRSQPKSKTI